ncbi:unnamed protein product [Kuraishia capsulata CBS 1993]|uniref:Mitochondrial carrier protein MTM1 n=1 Tax=Kuraishia capsulata CBS 1993 TaxID=1382522 RepID=W6MQI2_9ASCO|nr:uncharacterized protein KUCA_T00004566001 [Kuraishia capsulata CBS 1993]CDK28583.1 unnamed protein product [Kuraishia capsulata CBS 1993]
MSATEIATSAAEMELQAPPAYLSRKPHQATDTDIRLHQRMLSACAGSLITSLVVTPFDVVRIRLQQQHLLFPKKLNISDNCCRQPFWAEQSGAGSRFEQNPLTKVPVSNAKGGIVLDKFCETHACAQDLKIKGTFQGLFRIAKDEGFLTIYRGLSLMLVMAVPSNIVYFSGYEYLRDHSPINDFPVLNPLMCGGIARIMAATAVSPIELLKTRMQAIPADIGKSSNVMKLVFKKAYEDIQAKGARSIFTGLQLTLWRDVPFSAIYWASYEYISRALKEHPYLKPSEIDPSVKGWSMDPKVFASSFISGSVGGIIAALFTNPFDVGKTRLQVSGESINPRRTNKGENMFKFLIDIVKNEGVGALYVGLFPRCLKIAPACAIMISIYEVSKRTFSSINSQNLSN